LIDDGPIRHPFDLACNHCTVYLPPFELQLETFSVDACSPYHTQEIHAITLEKIPAFLLAMLTSTFLCFAKDPFDMVSAIRRLIEFGIEMLTFPMQISSIRIIHDLVAAHRQHPRFFSLVSGSKGPICSPLAVWS